MFLILALSSSMACFSQDGQFAIRHINPSSVSTPRGYSHSVEIDLGNCKMLFISGQVALDSAGNLVGKGDLQKQSEQVLLNMKHIILESGGSMDDIIKLGIYMTDVSKVQVFRDVRDRFINLQSPPASTLVQVSRLFREDILIEVEATVVISKVRQ